MKGYIYVIKNIKNNKFYVGSTLNITKRKHRHFYELKYQRHHSIYLQRAYNKYGKNSFVFMIKKEYHDIPELKLRNIEERYINFCLQYACLYNVSKKACGGDMISYHPNNKEFRELQSRIVKKRYEKRSEKEKIEDSLNMIGEKNPNYGKLWNNDQKLKQSNRLKKYYKTHKPPLKGKTFEQIYGLEEAKIKKKNLSLISSERIGKKNGFYGKKHSEETKKILSEKKKGHLPTNPKKVEYDGITYCSAKECATQLNISFNTICYRCRKELYGFKYLI